MKAIILGAGQGRRLLPLTSAIPKCLVPMEADRPVLDFQLQALAESGIQAATVMVGFEAARVEHFLTGHSTHGIRVKTQFNPLFAKTDNLITAWLARTEMTEEFVLVNGDTLFEPNVLRRLLGDGSAPVNVAIDQKAAYDEDDMKVAVNGHDRLVAISKRLGDLEAGGEAIGLTAFRGSGVQAFRDALEKAVRDPRALNAWYTSVMNDMASKIPVQVVSIHGLWWREIDCRRDLDAARSEIARRARRRGRQMASGAQTA